MSLVLISPELDVWKPGGHTGTFRGNNLAFVGATAALRTYWADAASVTKSSARASCCRAACRRSPRVIPVDLEARGRGLFQGLASLTDSEFRGPRVAEAFENGVVIETAGAYSEVVKFLPPLTIDDETLLRGVDVVEAAVEASRRGRRHELAHGSLRTRSRDRAGDSARPRSSLSAGSPPFCPAISTSSPWPISPGARRGLWSCR